ncbi:MAG: HAD-IIIC family phosphatase [Candidatus Methylomirabilales bacterium]
MMSARKPANQVGKAGSQQALADLLTLAEREPTMTNFMYAAERLDRLDPSELPLTELRLAIVRSFTLEPAIPFLKVLCAKAGYYLRVYLGPHNQVQQEVLDPVSGLYTHRPDVIVLAVRLEELDPELASGFAALSAEEVAQRSDAVIGTISGLVRQLRERSSAQVVVYKFAVPPYPAFGILDSTSPLGQTEAIRRLNWRLVEAVRAVSGAYVFDYDGLVAYWGRRSWQDPKLWHLAKVPVAREYLFHFADWHVQFIRAIRGWSRKVLVLDLDETLWGGIVGEEGPEGIRLGHDYPGSAYLEFQRVVLSLYHRGVILAINSKNEEALALRVLERHPDMLLRPHHFAAMRINWRDKAENMRALAEELNVGLDSFVFVDDSRVERELMRRLLPEVLTIELPEVPLLYARTLEECREFDSLGFSEEDRRRGEMYQMQLERARLRDSSASLEESFHSLGMRLEASVGDEASIARVAQLTQKTNQFNLTTRRYTEEEIRALNACAKVDVWSFRLVDRFGDNGIIAVVIVRRGGEDWGIDTFLMSCRVMGRGVETAILSVIVGEAKAAGVKRVRGRYVPTAKNAPVRDLYSSHGFETVESSGDGTGCVLDVRRETVAPPAWCPVVLRGIGEIS